MKIGIVGSRRRNTEKDFEATLRAFDIVADSTCIIVSGGCPKGGDKFAEMISEIRNVPILIYYPQWEKFGRSAGFQRNTLIAKDADILIACVAVDRTGGTEDTIKKYYKLGKRNLILC